MWGEGKLMSHSKMGKAEGTGGDPRRHRQGTGSWSCRVFAKCLSLSQVGFLLL